MLARLLCSFYHTSEIFTHYINYLILNITATIHILQSVIIWGSPIYTYIHAYKYYLTKRWTNKELKNRLRHLRNLQMNSFQTLIISHRFIYWNVSEEDSVLMLNRLITTISYKEWKRYLLKDLFRFQYFSTRTLRLNAVFDFWICVYGCGGKLISKTYAFINETDILRGDSFSWYATFDRIDKI